MMRRKIKLLTIITIASIAIITVAAILFRMPSLPEKPEKDDLTTFFKKHESTFATVASYLIAIKEDISIEKKDFVVKVDTQDGIKPYEISKEIGDTVKVILYKYGFVNIYEESNCIYFDKSVGFQWHQALVYSKDGKSPPQHRVRDFEEIGNGWYYYYGE